MFETELYGITARKIPGRVTGTGYHGECISLDVPGGPFVVLTAGQWNDLCNYIRSLKWSILKGQE